MITKAFVNWYYSRSREGAWIEISIIYIYIVPAVVAPVRERGLKSADVMERCKEVGRSREGAWIEIAGDILSLPIKGCRSREGAWIEIHLLLMYCLQRNRRSREGAWIEIVSVIDTEVSSKVAPVRERGLK